MGMTRGSPGPRQPRALGIHDHHPYLENGDDPAALADAAGAVDDGPTIAGQPDRQEHACEDRARRGETERSEDEVKRRLESTAPLVMLAGRGPTRTLSPHAATGETAPVPDRWLEPP